MTDAERIQQLEALCEEVWGVLVDAVLMDKTADPDVRAALARVDRRLREAGLKRFPPTKPLPAKGGVYMDAAVARELPESPK